MSGLISLGLFSVLDVFPAALLHTVRLEEPYQPHFIPPIWGHAVAGTQNSVPSPLGRPKKASNPRIEK